MGVGLGMLVGSGLRFLAPKFAKFSNTKSALTINSTAIEPKVVLPIRRFEPKVGLPIGHFEPKIELTTLSRRWRELSSQEPDIEASGFMIVLDDGSFAQINADRPMPAASSIKTPILLVTLEQIDAGNLHWNEPLALTKELVGGGAGWMATRPLGSRFPTYEVATEMIRISDNSATNILINRIGGKEIINKRFQHLGLSSTVIKNWLPDLDGTNTTSARDLCRTIALVDIGKLLSPRTRDLFRLVMDTSVTNTLLPTGLMRGLGGRQGNPDITLSDKGYRIYNKTGDIGIAYADAGLIELPDGRRAVAGFLVRGPFNNPRSTKLIRSMAEAMAPHLKPNPMQAQRTKISP